MTGNVSKHLVEEQFRNNFIDGMDNLASQILYMLDKAL